MWWGARERLIGRNIGDYLCDEFQIKMIKWHRWRKKWMMNVHGYSDVAGILHCNHCF
jgi:hypothetical protein